LNNCARAREKKQRLLTPALKPDRGEASQALSEARRLKRRPLASRSIPRLNPKIKPKTKIKTKIKTKNQNQKLKTQNQNQNQNQNPFRILLDSFHKSTHKGAITILAFSVPPGSSFDWKTLP
jgi:fructose-1-phosphate kinase PfkB-like protein